MDSDDESFDEHDSGNVSSGDDDFAMDVDINNPRDRGQQEDDYPFEVLTTEEIVQHMVDCIKDVNNVFGEIPATTTRILLNHFKWDKEKLMERYYDTDQEKLFKDAHVINPFRKPSTINKPKIKKSGTEDCEICYSSFPPSMMTGLECGHRFCTQCWQEYLTTKIVEEGLGQSIACAAHGCDILVDDVTVMRLVQEPRVKLKYQHLITNSFVEVSLRMMH